MLHKAHPWAAPLWPFTAGLFWFLLTVTLILLLLAGLLAVVVKMTGG